jgi:hypothetical protein
MHCRSRLRLLMTHRPVGAWQPAAARQGARLGRRECKRRQQRAGRAQWTTGRRAVFLNAVGRTSLTRNPWLLKRRGQPRSCGEGVRRLR